MYVHFSSLPPQPVLVLWWSGHTSLYSAVSRNALNW